MSIVNLTRLHATIVAAGVAIDGVSSQGVVTPSNLQAAAQATIDAFDDSAAAQAVFLAKQVKAAATAGIDNGQLQGGDKFERLCRAVALSALDALNNDRQAMLDMASAVAAASSLADLKTRFAAISFPPQITGAQLVASIKAKIAATAE